MTSPDSTFEPATAETVPINVLGVPVRAWSPNSLIDAMITRAQGRSGPLGDEAATVLYANVSVLNAAYSDARLRRTLAKASTVYCDGSGVRLGAWILGERLPPRLTAADWLDDLCVRAAAQHLRLYLVGGSEGVAAEARHLLSDRHPGLEIVGAHHGFLDEHRSGEVVADINRTRPGIVVLGMGTPFQEDWIARWRDEVHAPVLWGVGALLDFVVGKQRRAPRWMRDHHLEWLWRLGTDPLRLGHRYLVGNPLFIARVLRQRLTYHGG